MREHNELTATEHALGNMLRASFAELSLTPAQRQRHLEQLGQLDTAHRETESINTSRAGGAGRIRDLAQASPVSLAASKSRPRFTRTLEGAALILIVLIFAAGALLARALMPGRGSSSPNPAAAPAVSTVYAVQQTAAGASLLPLDPITLADQPGSPLAPPTTNWAVSADGSTMVTFDYVQGATMIIVRDGFTGPVRSRFAAPISALISSIEINRDGSRVLVNRQLEPSQWAVIDTTSGKLLMSLDTQSPKLNFDTPMQADSLQLNPDGTRLYRFVFTDRADATGTQPLRVIEYDAATGKQLASQTYTDIQVGSWHSHGTTEADSVSHFQQPGIAFSPDGREIALVHPDGEAVTLIDAKTLTVARTITLSQATSLLEWALRRIGIAPQPAAAKMLDGVQRSAVFSPDGTTLFTWGNAMTTDTTGGLQGLGFTRVDLTNGTTRQIFPGALIDQVQPSPDGTSIYVTGYRPTTSTLSPPHFVRRLDPQSLQTLAERSWPDVYSFELVTKR